MQILVQVLATVIECGTVTDTSAVVSFEDFQRPPPGFVTVEEAVDAPVPVQVFHRLAYVGDGVQHKAVAIAAYAEAMARVRKYPITAYLVVSFFPLVPGSYIYYAMYYAVQQDMDLSADFARQTALYALGIALGASLVWALADMRRHLKQNGFGN